MDLNNNFIDLHTHSNKSDGSFSPSELIRYAASKNLAAIALSDHDTMAGIKEAIKATESENIRFIPAIELGAVYGKKEVHILGYVFDNYEAKCKAIDKALKNFSDKRKQRNLEIVERLCKDNIILDFEELEKESEGSSITRVHIAKALIRKNYADSISFAFEKYLSDDSKYVPEKSILVKDVMDFFKQFNFYTSLAHPCRYKLSEADLEKLIRDLTKTGLDALEVYHSSQQPSDSTMLKKLAKKYDLGISGGSDFHGSNKPDIDIGIGYGGLRVPLSVLSDMERDFLAK
jgi:predicted metal-dependent phosphoesterases (PHP family)